MDYLPELLRQVINAAMQMERQKYLGVEPYERGPERRDQANGYKFQEGGEFPVTIYTPAPEGGESGALIVSVAPLAKIYLPVLLR